MFTYAVSFGEIYFAELLDNHVLRGKEEERRKQDKGKEGEKEKLSPGQHSSH